MPAPILPSSRRGAIVRGRGVRRRLGRSRGPNRCRLYARARDARVPQLNSCSYLARSSSASPPRAARLLNDDPPVARVDVEESHAPRVLPRLRGASSDAVTRPRPRAHGLRRYNGRSGRRASLTNLEGLLAGRRTLLAVLPGRPERTRAVCGAASALCVGISSTCAQINQCRREKRHEIQVRARPRPPRRRRAVAAATASAIGSSCSGLE